MNKTPLANWNTSNYISLVINFPLAHFSIEEQKPKIIKYWRSYFNGTLKEVNGRAKSVSKRGGDRGQCSGRGGPLQGKHMSSTAQRG